MNGLFRLSGGVRRNPAVDAWLAGGMRVERQADVLFAEPADQLRALARFWFDRIRACGPDVRDLLHDGGAVACVGDAAFAHVNIHKAHVNLGFFHGASLADPAGLLQGAGKRMRHVSLRPEKPVETAALNDLIATAYRDVRLRLAGG